MGTVLGGAIGGVVGTVVGELARLAMVRVTGDTPSTTVTVLAAAVGAGIGGGVQEAIQLRRPGRARQPSAVAGALVGLVSIVALFGAGAFAVSRLVGKLTGNQTGVERLAEPPPTGTAAPRRMTVESVIDTPDFLKLKVRLANDGDIPIMLFTDSCQLIGADGTPLKAFGGFTGLGDDIEAPEGTAVTSTLSFKGQPLAQPMKLSCSRLFGMGFNVPNSITVAGIRLTPA